MSDPFESKIFLKRTAGKPSLWLFLLLASAVSSPLRLGGEAMLQYFNTSWSEITKRMPELAEAGYSSLWLPPPTKGSGGLSVGYDLWDPLDLGGREQRGTFGIRYGTEAELNRMIETAHRFGIRVYFDNIMNHRAFEVPGYNDHAPHDLYPGMRPEDFHLRRTEDGYYRKWDNVREWWSEWQVQNLGLADLADIATEPGKTNRNFGSWEGATTDKIKFLRHPNNPEFYYSDANGTYVGFGKDNGLTISYLKANESYYSEYVEDYLNRAVRWLMDRTKADGLRLDAVKHIPPDFFGATYGDDRDRSNYGYLGQAQEQYNLTRGFSDWNNHRDTVFDTEIPRDDAMMFGEHLGAPPAVGDYLNAGMRLLDNDLRHHLNGQLGNPWGTLSGLDSAGSHGFSPGSSVMHAQSHDSDYAARRELQHALYLTRAGIGIIYSDGNHHAGILKGSGGAFPRHSNTNFLGQWGDNRIPNLLYFHEHFARGHQVGRWSDGDVVVYERVDKRDNQSMSDAAGTVGLVMLNDNYSAGQSRSFTTGFPSVGGTDNDAYLYNYSSYGGGFYKYASQLSQVVIPAGGYFLFSWRSPESSDLWELSGGHPLTILQDGKQAGTVSVKRTDGEDGDPGFNPYGVPDQNRSDYSYLWEVPRVTDGKNLKFVIRADGSADNVLLKLDGGIDLNANGKRDNPPALSTDVYLGFEQMNFKERQGPEKFAAREVIRNTIGSAGAETYQWKAEDGTFTVSNGVSGGDAFLGETAHWVYHDPETANDRGEKQFQVESNSATLWVKVGYALEANQVRLYYLKDEGNPEGAGGTGIGQTKVESFSFSHSDNQEPNVDWWKATLGLPDSGSVKYKIGVYRNESNDVAPASVFPKNERLVSLKKKMMTTFEIDGFDGTAIEHYPHNDWGEKATGLKEGFHFLRGRAFLSRLGQSPIYNTFVRTFYYDVKRPEGEVAFPATEGEELFGSEYGFLVRTDSSVTEVLFHVEDGDPTNDDEQTGAKNGNGRSGKGSSNAWANAMEVPSRQDLDAKYPKEWRFSYRNVPTGGGEATVRVALKEISSSSDLRKSEEEGHFKILERKVRTSGPSHRLFVTWPQSDGEKVGKDYVMKTYVSAQLLEGKSDEQILSNLRISVDASVNQTPPYESAVSQDVSKAWVERDVSSGLSSIAYKLPILRNPEGAPTDFRQTIIVDYKDETAGVDMRTVRTVTTDFIDHGPVNPILTVNGIDADYTTTHLFVDELNGSEEKLEVVMEARNLTMAEVYTNLNNRNRAELDSNDDGIEDGIQPPPRDWISSENNDSYYQVHPMTYDPTRGESGAWVCSLNARKTGAYRLTARFKLKDDADVWHWYTDDGRRDHAVVVTPSNARNVIMHELNPLSVDATGDTFETRSTLEDLHDENRWNLDYLKGMGANWLWFQPIHPRGEDGREAFDGKTYDPGSPYAVKNFFEIMPQLSKANTREGSMQAFRDFVNAADTDNVGVMIDAPFNHVAWDVEQDEQGVKIFGSGSPEDQIRKVNPEFFSREGDYGSPARNENEIATAPDRSDFGKWKDVKDVYFGNYSSLVRGNDPAERNPHQNEEDVFDFRGSGWNEQTRKTWKYFASYVPYWLEKTGLPSGQSIEIQSQTGIDGLRADFGQGLPPRLWEYLINVARTRKWSFVFMSEALDGGAVTYRSSRHFDVLNENLLFSLKIADSSGSYRQALENRKSAYGQSLILLNNVSHDEENHGDPWQAFIRYAAMSAHAGIPMTFMGQELGTSTTYGFNHYETNFGKQIPHFKRYNSMQPIWDNNDFGLDQLYKAYASVAKARNTSPALRSPNRYFLNESSSDAAHPKIHAVAKWGLEGSSPASSEVVLAFVNLDRDNARSGTFDLSPESKQDFLGIGNERLYNITNLAAFSELQRDKFLWTEARTGKDLLENGIFVKLNPVPNNEESWGNAPFEAQFLKLHDLTSPALEVNGAIGGTAFGTGSFAYGSDAAINAIPDHGYSFDGWIGEDIANPELPRTTVRMSRAKIVRAKFKLKTHKLEINSSGGGMVTGEGNYSYGSDALIGATPYENHHFVNWIGAGIANSTSADTTVNLTSDRNLTAIFAIDRRTLSVRAGTGGSATGEGTFEHGSTTNLRAIPEQGFDFVKWTGSSVLEATSESTTITLIADANVTANFQARIQRLSISVDGAGQATGDGNYTYGEPASIRALPDQGHYFKGWSGIGVVDSNSSSTEVLMTADRNVSAVFAAIPPNKHLLRTFSDPSHSGATGGGGVFDENNTSTLRALPASGYYFLGWTAFGGTLVDPLSADSAKLRLDQDSDANATAHFDSLPEGVTVNFTDGGTASVENNNVIGRDATLSASPIQNHKFSGWQVTGHVVFSLTAGPRRYQNTENSYFIDGKERPPLTLARGNSYSFSLDGSTTGNHPFYFSANPEGGGKSYNGEYLEGVTNSRATSGSITIAIDERTPTELYYHCGNHAGMGNRIRIIEGTNLLADANAPETTASSDASYAVLATFGLIDHRLELKAGPGGTVSGNGNFEHGTAVPINANPATGYKFSSWSGEGVNDANSASTSALMTKAISLTANFEPTLHALSVISESETKGFVIGSGSFSHGQIATITAFPKEGFVFSKWEGSGIDDPKNKTSSVTVTASTQITGVFSPSSHRLNLNSIPDGAGTLTGAGEFSYGSEANVTATPDTGYVFSKWSGKGVADETASATTVLMNQDGNLTAHFVSATHELKLKANPTGGGYVIGGGLYTHGHSASVSASPGKGYVFSGWAGGGVSNANSSSTTVIMNSPKELAASFSKAVHSLNLESDPPDAGLLFGAGSYSYGTVIDVNASAKHGYSFRRWESPDLKDFNGSEVSVAMLKDTRLTAHFSLHRDSGKFHYSIGAVDREGGWRESDWFGIFHQIHDNWVFHSDLGWIFVDTPSNHSFWFWRDPLGWLWTTREIHPSAWNDNTKNWIRFRVESSTGKLQKDERGNLIYYDYSDLLWKASSIEPKAGLYEIEVLVEPSSGGNVNGGGKHAQGVEATLVATPQEGYRFMRWEGIEPSLQNPIEVRVTRNFQLTAHFEKTIGEEEKALPNKTPNEENSSSAGNPNSGSGNYSENGVIIGTGWGYSSE